MLTYRCRYRSHKEGCWFVSIRRARSAQLAIQFGFVELGEFLDQGKGQWPPYADWYLADIDVQERPSWSYLPVRSVLREANPAVRTEPPGWTDLKAFLRRKWGV